MHIVCIIQARMGSTRLPGKVLKELLGVPVLWWDIHRIQKSTKIDDVVVATTEHPEDDKIVSLCQTNGWKYFRGSEHDVLDRYYQAATLFSADTIVRITSDCPLIEPLVIDKVIEKYESLLPEIDYVSNIKKKTFPNGFAVEVMSYEALFRAWSEDSNPDWREHVTPYIYKNAEHFCISDVCSAEDLSQYRVTLDTPEDFELIRKIYEHFGHGDFSMPEWLAFLRDNPELCAINTHIQQRSVDD